MAGDTFSGPKADDVRRLTALVEAQASRLAALEQNSISTKQRSARRAGWGRGMVLLALLGGVAAAASGSAVAAPNIVAGGSGLLTACYGTKTVVKFLPNPVRILDTRDGTGVAVAGTRPAVTTTAVQTNGVVAGAVAIIGNVTVTNTQAGYLTLYPGGTRPLASTINFNSGWTIANHVQTGLAGDGTFQIYNVSATDIVFDALAGIYPVSKGLRLIDPVTETCAADETLLTWNQIGPVGPAGPIGATGATGATGAEGPPGVSGWHVVTSVATPVTFGQTLRLFVRCGFGEKVFGGGGAVVGEGPGPFNVLIRESDPGSVGSGLTFANGWLTSMVNNEGFLGATHTLQFFAVCGFAS